MSAKEMFEELGYEQEEYKDKIAYHLEQVVLGQKNCFGVSFDKDFKSYHTYAYGWFENGTPFDTNLCIDIKLHKAINKQIEELGWLKDK